MLLLESSFKGLIDWNQVMFGEHDWTFLIETGLRTVMMFIVVLIGLTLLGKRGVKQLSVFELVVIIGLGSAAGDPMFYKEVGILPAIVVFSIVISLYVLVTYLVAKSNRFEKLVEGKPVCLIREGRFAIDNFKKEALAQDEFFAELRLQHVSHLGQVEQAIVETSGEISVFYYEDVDVKYGLSIMPDGFKTKTKKIIESAAYSCTFCGYTENLTPVNEHVCLECGKQTWVKSTNRKRVS